MVLTAAGQTLTVPTYLLRAAGQRSSARRSSRSACHLRTCPSGRPAGRPSGEGVQRRARDQRRLQRGRNRCVDLLLDAVQPGRGYRRTSPVRIVAPGGDRTGRSDPRGEELRARRDAHRRASRRPGQAAVERPSTISAVRRRHGSRRLGRATVAANGRFAFKAKTGTFFRARRSGGPGCRSRRSRPACDRSSRRFRASTRR
mgnify:CR=1 FL=1